MLKSIQFRIVISFIVIGLIFICAFGYTSVYNLDRLQDRVAVAQSGHEVTELVESNKIFMQQLSIALAIAFVASMILMGMVISKVLFNPILNLIKSAEKATKGGKYLNDGNEKNEIKNLAVAFDNMNNELKENLNEATRARKQTETILLHMTDGILAFNTKGEIIHINPAAKKLMKLTNEKNFNEIFEKYSEDINLEKLMYLDNIASTQMKIVVEDKFLNLFFASFKDENDRNAGLIVVIQDITERERLDGMRKRFVADVSHELKTPITSIMGYADTLLEGDIDGEINHKFLERISAEASRMAKLVTDLLTLSKYDTSKVNIEKKEFDLGELVKYIYEGMEIEMEKKKQTGGCYIVNSNIPAVYADKDGIERVIINVLSNAIKYTPENGEISAYVGCVYNDAYIKITDTGIGIPAEDIDKLYERFYRVDKARTREMGGTGLGLSIAKEILDQNDCKIGIKSEVGKGTEVVIRIPTVKNREKNEEEIA